MKTLLINVIAFLNNEDQPTTCQILIDNETILSIGEKLEINEDIEIVDCLGNLITPAFIDNQIYGAAGKLFSEYRNTESLAALALHNKNNGTSDCLVCIATQPLQVIYESIGAIKKYWAINGEGIYGMHLEGPFINEEKRGAHLKEFILQPTEKLIKEIFEYAEGVIKMITLAPEFCTPEMVSLILSYNCIISAGHSNATFTQANNGFNSGITTTTHLYNAMSPLQHRNPGLVGAVMLHPIATASIIPDGIHVTYEAVKIAKQVMGNRLYFITDAVTDTLTGNYPHIFNADHYVVADGTLSGSSLTMLQAVKNAVAYCNIPLYEALNMCSLYPARVLGLCNKRGKIEVGYMAKLILLNNTLELQGTIGF